MLSSLIKGLFQRPTDRSPSVVSPDWLERLKVGCAVDLRDDLKAALEKDKNFPFPALLEAARVAGWSDSEWEKLAAYGDYYSGRPELAHRRVMAGRLAETDYPLFVTACEQCYTYNRFDEGYALLKQFRIGSAEGVDVLRFNDLAGYMAFCGGGTLDEACQYYDAALASGKLSPQLAVNAYPVYFEAGRHREADFLHNQLLEHCADDAQALYALAWGELARDYYPEGFRLAEARYRMPEMAPAFDDLLARPRWQGDSLAGRRLFIRGEQGYGDLFMMARYLPLLLAQGGDIHVECQEPAIPLLASNFPQCHFLPGGTGQPAAAEFDVWTGLMSLPFHFSTTARTVPGTPGYLQVPSEHAAYWKTRCAETSRAGAPKIGLAWAGNSGHRYDRRRSLRFDSVADHLQRLDGVDFFALQTQVPASRPANLLDLSAEMLTFADTAAVIAEMDLVITVDTSVVHLAGALGKPTWLLLPHRYEWRWCLEGERNHWYDSVRVLRQPAHGDWASLLAEVFDQRLPAWRSDRTT